MEDPTDHDIDGFPIDSPLRYNEVVEIHPLDFDAESETIEMIGKRGVVSGYAFNGGEWAYSVAIQSGENWYFQMTELESLGLILTDEELYGPPVKKEWARIRVDVATGEGTCIAGDPSFINRGPAPLHINLEELRAKR